MREVRRRKGAVIVRTRLPDACDRHLLSSAFSLDRVCQDRPTFTSQSDLVVLHVSVRDRGGRYISGLERDAFTVIDAGKPQTIAMFAADDVPATVGILIDNSNSMRPHREIVIRSRGRVPEAQSSTRRDPSY